MSSTQIIVLVAVVLVVLGIFIIPRINRNSLAKMPFDQQIRVLMMEAKGLSYFKNISEGSNGTLIYIKNKRKIIAFPWVLIDGKMVCTKAEPLSNWDYPEEKAPLTDDEKELVLSEIEKYNKKQPVKFSFDR